jgi:hypothetical protein
MALEVDFHDHGEFESDGVVRYFTPPRLAVEEWFFAARFMTPIYKKLSLTAQLGASYASFDARGERIRIGPAPPPGEFDPDGTLTGGRPPPDYGVVVVSGWCISRLTTKSVGSGA